MLTDFLKATVLLCLGSLAAVADEPDNKEASPANDIEEITVVGDETVPRLRHQLRRIDQEFFKLYNELNSNDELDMICKRETRIGSQIPRTVCKSRRHRELQSERAQDVFEEDGAYFAVSQSWRSKHYKEVRENVTRVLGESAELTKIMQNRAELRRRIQTLKEEQTNK